MYSNIKIKPVNIFLLFLVLSNSAAYTQRRHLLIEDNFESGNKNEYWKEELHFPYAGAIVNSPTGNGKVFRFEWRKADYDKTNKTKHAELRSPWLTENKEQWVGFSCYFPSNTMAVDSSPVIIMQYHDVPDRELGEDWRNPVIALSLRNHTLNISYRGDSPPLTVMGKYETSESLSLGAIVNDQWIHFVFHVKFDAFGKGLLEAWVNGEQKTSRKNIQLGFNDKNGSYFKFGMYYYEGRSAYNRTSYCYDDVRIGDAEAGYSNIAPEGALAKKNKLKNL